MKKSRVLSPRKNNLVQLTNDQLETLRVLDRQIRDEFLKKQPKIDQTVRQYPAVKKALENWGKDGSEKTKA